MATKTTVEQILTVDEDIDALHARIAELESQLPKPKVQLKSEDLQHLPNVQIGVSERAIQRAKLMARPICPVDDEPEIQRVDASGNRWVEENPNYTGDPNCQRISNGAPGWWSYCEAQGHDPYFTVTKRVRRAPVVKDGLITGYTENYVETRKLNTCRVAIALRVNSGRGEEFSKGLKGRKTLEELGYWGKCEFRNCEMDWKYDSKYGRFCSERHARLVGADVEVIMLDPRKRRNFEKSLKDLGDVASDGRGYRLQEVPDVEDHEVLAKIGPIEPPAEGAE